MKHENTHYLLNNNTLSILFHFYGEDEKDKSDPELLAHHPKHYISIQNKRTTNGTESMTGKNKKENIYCEIFYYRRGDQMILSSQQP